MGKRSLRSLAVSALVPAALVLASAGSVAAAAPSTPTTAPSTSPHAALVPLVDLVAQRLATADTVAAAKFGTPSPIEDPAREEVVLDTAAAKAREQGLDADVVRAVFTDQIQANKVVQYGLYSRWTAHPDQAPTTHPDLAQVRPVLDSITEGLVRELAATQDVRADDSCAALLERTEHHVAEAHDFDDLHDEAFDRALVSVCG
jgi:chorismate mutase